MPTRLSTFVMASLTLGIVLGIANAAEEKRQLLSDHKTVARFTGVAYHQCRGLTSLCPDNCGQSGDFASFTIIRYLEYKKPGQYGDPKSKEFMFQVEDNHHNLKVDKALAEQVKGLKEGDWVLLNWQHDYVTRTENGGSSSSPERPVTKVQKISKEEADRLLKAAETQPADTFGE